MDLLTVLMPATKPHPRYLREAIGSLFAQTDSAWQLLVIVEAGERAAIGELLAAELADSRVALVVNEGRKLAGAFNSGMRAATTAFVAILLSDDLWAPNAVEALGDARRRHPDIDFFHSGRRIIDDEGRAVSAVHPPRESFVLSDFVAGSPVKHLLCWRRDKGLACGGMDETLNSVGPDDYDFPWTMADHGANFRAIPAALYVYRDHRSGYRLTTHLPRNVHVRELRRILAKHGVAPAKIRQRIGHAKRTHLRQCLYRNAFDRWLKRTFGFEARIGWRDTYR